MFLIIGGEGRQGLLASGLDSMRSTISRLAPVVDMHSHFLPRTWPDFMAKFGGDGWPSMRHDGALPEGTFGYGASILGERAQRHTLFVGL